MTSSPHEPDPVDVAVSYPGPPNTSPSSTATPSPTGHPAQYLPPVAESTPPDGRLAAPPAGGVGGSAEVVLSAERLTTGTEWTVSGGMRFRRRIATYTRTVEVTLRREELEVEVRDVAERDGVWVGTEYRGPAVPPPPVVTGPGVFTLREEVPEVTVRAVPYERVVVTVERVTDQVRLTETARRERAMVSGDTETTAATPGPSRT